ncbi:hypothetical protein [Leifsonia sp. 22587]|uniref:hypothetical protein n=1 Tax=Leifsonia sp. 22587 TaxID=3453946 RepID=UPI003F828D5C
MASKKKGNKARDNELAAGNTAQAQAQGVAAPDERPKSKNRRVAIGAGIASLVIAPLIVIAFTPTADKLGTSMKAGISQAFDHHADAGQPFAVLRSISYASKSTYAKADADVSQRERAYIVSNREPSGWTPAGDRVDGWTIRNTSDDKITIESISIADAHASQALAGAFASLSEGGRGGDTPVYNLVVDLDSGRTLDTAGADYFRQQTITLRPAESAIIYFAAKPPKGTSYSWVLKFAVLIGPDRSATVYSGKNGKTYPKASAVPSDQRFAVTAVSPDYSIAFGTQSPTGPIQELPNK